jgi:isopentenyl-diphosphate Delta-isomerase
MADELIQRKADHMRLAARPGAQHHGTTLLECVRLIHQALPELALSEIDLSTEFFGKRLKLPLMITSMSGGTEDGARLNRELAQAAAAAGSAFAVGSQRVMLRHPERQADFDVRRFLPPGAVLLGNIGAQQLAEYAPEQIANLAAAIDADGLCIHLNAAHELAQDAGERSFKNLLHHIALVADKLDGRVLVKETGAGLSPEALLKLRDAGVIYVDVAGAGGTSWPKVELMRAETPAARLAGEVLADWGLPTAFCTIAAARTLPDSARIVASGGIRSGLDAARALACGAHLAGLAAPVLSAWLDGGQPAVAALIARLETELRILLLLTGCRTVADLHRAPRVYVGELSDWLASYGWLFEEGRSAE